ncbi:MAG: FliM/FliN family flagellar motor switch protein [Gemmatales bacterium]|nr:FliM/FliN family flagellar motor switch protein [Gemmatales bacterium]MDW7995820.1 FliM/FliN family flagellar motor switch protein [Gemmatales bacterium]
MTGTVQPFDWRHPQPEPSEVRRAVARWLSALTQHWTEVGRRRLGLALQFRPGKVRRCYVAQAFDDLPDQLLYYSIHWSDHASSLLGIPRPLALVLTLALLGESTDSLPTDRPLTAIETSLWEHVLDREWLTGMQACWQGSKSPSWQRGPLEPVPQFSPALKQQLTVLRAEAQAEWAGAKTIVVWLLTEALIREFFAPAAPATETPSAEALAQGIPLHITVRLGETLLPLRQLQQLRAGDVLLLNQRLDEPLAVLVEGEVRYRAWPGRLGRKRAVQITAFWES